MPKVLIVKPIPVPKKGHPDPPNEVLLKHEFTLGLIAPKGSGKTTMICNLLDFYKGYFHNIIIFSPTVHNDDKWDWVKKQSFLSQNMDLINWVRKQDGERHEARLVSCPVSTSEFEEMPKYDPNFDGKIDDRFFHETYSSDTLAEILNEQDTMIKKLKKHKASKFLANRLLFIFDDLVGSSLFGNERANVFNMFNTRHRHFSSSIIMVSQGYKEIPKIVRTGYSGLILFDISNDKELEVIFEEFSMGLKKPQWLEAFAHCVAEEFGFMFLNFQREKKLRIMKGFNEYLMFK